MPVVGRERQVDAAVGHDLVDRLVDDPVLIGRLGEVGEIVEDDPRACGGKREDVVREVRLAAESGREGERGAGSDVVDDLQHRPAFVGVGRGGAFLDDLDPGRRKVAAQDVRRRAAQAVVAVGQHADPEAGAVEAERGPRRVRALGDVALGRDQAGGGQSGRFTDEGEIAGPGEVASAPSRATGKYPDAMVPKLAPPCSPRAFSAARSVAPSPSLAVASMTTKSPSVVPTTLPAN